MELNAELIKKALECCLANDICDSRCGECQYKSAGADCMGCMLRDALALINSQEQRIKELTEENERLRSEKEAAIEDLEHCMYFAKPKKPNTCNFCTHDCEVSKDGTRCKGKEDWIYCSPVWRGFVKPKAEGE
jgi:hypothetical protein